jgi:hypothetical protein
VIFLVGIGCGALMRIQIESIERVAFGVEGNGDKVPGRRA